MAENKAIGFRHFSLFSKELEKHSRRSENVMGLPLLHHIQDIFGYAAVSLSNYDQYRFNGIEVVSDREDRDISEIKQSYSSYFQKRDPFAAYIGKMCIEDPHITTLQSSSALKKGCISDEYYRYLKHFNLKWSLAMPIGNYRLTVYRDCSEPDFSDSEREAMELLSQLIRKEYFDCQNVSRLVASCRLEGRVLNSLGVGFLLFDRFFHAQFYNQIAGDYLNAMKCAGDLRQKCSELYSRISQSKFIPKNPSITSEDSAIAQERLRSISPVYLDSKGRTLLLEKVFDSDSDEQYWSITIYTDHNLACRRVTPESLMLHFDLSEREAEVAQLVAEGRSYQETAEALYISINTVRTHVCNLYRKMGIDNRHALNKVFQALASIEKEPLSLR